MGDIRRLCLFSAHPFGRNNPLKYWIILLLEVVCDAQRVLNLFSAGVLTLVREYYYTVSQ